MNTKKCSKCKEAKPLAEFSKHKARKDGHKSQCKGCVRQYRHENKDARKLYYEENKVDILERQKRYQQANKKAIAEKAKLYYEENKVARAEYQKRYNEKNKVARAEYQKQYNQANKESIAEWRKQYHQTNKSTLMPAMVKYARERRAKDPLYRLTHNVRGLIYKSFRNGGYSKKSKTAEILGCSFDEYHQHIEAQFTDGMSWQRMSEIHIDHRLPLSAANTEAELLVLNHYRNLQPLWATENLAKSDSYCPKELAAYFKKHLNNQ